MTGRRPGGRASEAGVSVATLAWLAGAALFVGLRGVAAFRLPVFGAEIDHLSGAWFAAIGVDDDRYVPTLFQAITAGLLRADDSELWPRLIAVAGSATIPAALYLLRPRLGEVGAWGALVLLGLNPLSIAMSSTANAMALDETVAAWLAVLFLRGWWNPATSAFAGFVVALSGFAPLLVVAAAASSHRSAWRALPWARLVAGAAGAAAGLVAASARFGLGMDELVVPPFDLLAAGSERGWATATSGELVILYVMPILVAAAAGAALAVGGRAPVHPVALWAWTALALGWWLFSLGTTSPAPAAALSLPAALVGGPVFACIRRPGQAADLRLGLSALAAMVVFWILAGAIVADWARLERSGPAGEQALVALFLAAATLAVVGIVYARSAALLVPLAVAAGLLWLVPGTMRITTGAAEPLTSPLSPDGARILRGIALAAAGDGFIVVHPDLEEAVAWPFRDSGTLLIASRVPPTASVLLWPASAPAPEGFLPLAGDWALTRTIRTPVADLLDYLHWMLDRNTLAPVPERIAIYTRAEP